MSNLCPLLNTRRWWKNNTVIIMGKRSAFMYIYIRQIVGYRTPVFIQRFPWRLHITITTVCLTCVPYWIQDAGEKIIRLFRIMSIPTTFRLFRVLTSEQIGRRLPMFTLLLWQPLIFIHFRYLKDHRLLSSLQKRNTFR
jgi:hypothetical protein